jgi:hypothetical protein
MIRAQRVFPQARSSRGVLVITDSEEAARDIEWFLDRYPLRMDDATRQHLTGQTTLFRDRQTAIRNILQGGRIEDLRDPARPARPYQQTAADLAITTGQLLVADEVGLGKSMTGTLVFRAPEALPGVVVCPTHLTAQWVDEIAKTLPWLDTYIIPRGDVHDPAGPSGNPPDVLVLPYSRLVKWQHHLTNVARSIVFDEVQELRHDRTQKYDAAALIAAECRYRVGLSASPVYNFGGEIHNIINILAPGALGSREEFAREWCGTAWITGPTGKLMVRNPAALGAFLREQGLMIRRTRTDVGRELPDVITTVESVEADPAVIERAATDAAEMARLILDRAGTSQERWRAAGEIDWKMREATGVAKAPFVAAFARLLLESETRIVLAGWHRAVYDLWLDLLADFNPVLYTGSETPTQKQESVRRFTEGDSRVFILSLRSGTGLNGLQDVSRVIVFGELDWSPQVHEQAIGRLNRDTTIADPDPVVAYYLVAESGSDPALAESLQIKRGQAEPMLSDDGKLLARQAVDRNRAQAIARHIVEMVERGRRTAPADIPKPAKAPQVEQMELLMTTERAS